MIIAFGMGLSVLGAFGIGRLQTTARLHDLLPANAPVLQDYAWLESHIGPLVPLEVVLRFPADDALSLLERAQLVERVRRVIASTPDVGNAISATMWAPPLPVTNGGLGSIVRRTVFNRALEERKDALEKTDLFRELDGEQLWRISAAAKASDEALDYGQLMHRLKTKVDPLLERHNASSGSSVTAVYTGSIPLMHKIQKQLLSDLIISFMAALILITLVMILVMRSIPAGLLCMIPNVMPSVIVFGALGWLGPSIEVGSMMTAGAAIGIAVDDTLHFMTWFQRGLTQGLNRVEAVRFAYRNCATAMLQTSLICGLGLLVFALSPFVPVARFGWMLAALLGTALLGDLVILPALLIGPLGAVFRSSNPKDYHIRGVHPRL
ncbi:MAG: MMPL family transporter [Planctomycetia bacterium]|nr:MMPL family transporter [Planctomycetia bacterium]